MGDLAAWHLASTVRQAVRDQQTRDGVAISHALLAGIRISLGHTVGELLISHSLPDGERRGARRPDHPSTEEPPPSDPRHQESFTSLAGKGLAPNVRPHRPTGVKDRLPTQTGCSAPLSDSILAS